MNEIRISPMAEQDLLDIRKYISNNLASPAAGLRILTLITKRIRDLATFPELGSLLNTIIEVQTNYRFLTCESYVVFYRHELEAVYVDRVLYGRRDFVRILFEQVDSDNN